MAGPGAVPGAAASNGLRSPMGWTIGLTVAFVLVAPIPTFAFFSSPSAYTDLHTVLELVSTSVSLMVFATAWNLRHRLDNSRIMLLGAASLGIAILDIAHMLSFPGMPEFVTPASTEKAIAFWLTARLLGAVAFALVALVPSRSWPVRAWYPLLAAVVVLAIAFVWVVLQRPEWLPRTFVQGEGLTRFKVASEYLIASVYAVAAVLLWRQARRYRMVEAAWLASAAWTLALAELFFTLYASVTDMFNLLGHVFKVIAYLMVYRAVFVAGVQEPFRQLAAERSRLRTLIDSVPDFIFFKDVDDRYVGANKAFERYSGRPEQELLGLTDPEVSDAPIIDDYRRDDRAVLSTGATVRSEEWIPLVDGTRGLYDTIKTPYRGPDGDIVGVIGVSREVTEQRRAEARLAHLATHDPLTDLPNAVVMAERVEQLGAADATAPFSVLFLDVDDFRTINDTIGHVVGDALLRQLADRVAAHLPEQALLARLGGDDFLVLLPGADADAATREAHGILGAVEQPFAIDDYELLVTLSIGVAAAPDDGTGFHDLLRGADSAVHRAKEDGRNAVRRYQPEMRAGSSRRLALLSALRRAVDHDELRVHYQPQVGLPDGDIRGVEALVRWEHPELGLLPPGDFIELAEDSGLIVPIGEAVMRRALTDLVSWRRLGIGLDHVSVNVSAVEFWRSDLPDRIEAVLADAGADPGMLDVELTESVAIRDPEAAVTVIERLHEMGVSVSLDDFGTGYSSMASLHRFHIDRLKIDRSFVWGISEHGDGPIVRAVIQMAHSLGCSTMAEGVETTDQLAFLSAEGCDAAQGFLFGRPMPGAQLLEVLLPHPSRTT